MSKKVVVIFSGFNMRAVYAFMRTLDKNSIDYAIIASSDKDDIFKTVYKKNVLAIRKHRELHLKDIIETLEKVQSVLQSDSYLIAPSTEALNRFLLKHRTVFDDLKCTTPLVEKELYEQISDKYNFGMLCKDYHIAIPREYSDLEDVKLPLVVKPKKYFGSNGEIYAPQILRDIKELKNFIAKYNKDDFYFQEYVDGRCIYLLYYFDKNKKVHKFSQENLIQQENGKSMLLAKSSRIHNDDISSKFEELFVSINFRGLVMVELKLMKNQFVMIEANPRFWGPSQLFVDANINFFNYLLEDYDISKFQDTKSNKLPEKTLYFWDDGISKDINSRQELTFYNYTREDFESDKSILNKIEIYNKEDTKTLYEENR